MALIDSPRLRPEDRTAWKEQSSRDLAHARTSRHRALVEEAELAVVRFAREPCYASVSWGKDSMVIADMVARLAPHVPLVFLRIEPIWNPDCAAVRDAFLQRFRGCRYDEIVEHEERMDGSGRHNTHRSGTFARGFRRAAELHGDRYLSGVRADESAGRRRAAGAYGLGTGRVGMPLMRWSARDVWAYLAAHDLPVHPAYAMTGAGSLDRDRIRVAAIGGERGSGTGRREWEEMYYADILRGGART